MHRLPSFRALCKELLRIVRARLICNYSSDFWAYFEPIRQNMPKNCSADVEAVITHIDQVFTTGSNSSIQSLKATFGLEAVTHNDDAAGARE
jgi:hypothetical protein